MDTSAFATRLQKELDARKLSVSALARMADLKRDNVRDMLRRDNASTSVERAKAIADALGLSLDEMLTGQQSRAAPVVGRVGAGAAVDLVDAYAHGDGQYFVARPPQLGNRRVVAVEVIGDSMQPAYQPGDVLFYTRDALGVPAECEGRRCVAEDDAGHAWVKVLRRRDNQPPGLWDLHSINQAHPPIYDAALRWAAPVLFHLGGAFAERLPAPPGGDEK